ncbi:MAG TPA: DUF4340 domain-containing protein, partial [Planctomycetota bacterium]|nr:DUF4340 domain-containing protein [Planctomycetota bacterium]
MNWKPTIVLAALAAAAFGAWFIIQPVEESNVIPPRPFEGHENTYQSISIRIPDQPEKVLRRHPSPVLGSLWHLESPAVPVDDTRVHEMIDALRKLSRERAIKPGDPAHTPSVYGLDKPPAVVDVVVGGEKRTVKFGNASTRQPDFLFFMIEGEPQIYMGPAASATPFHRPIAELRSRIILSHDPAKVVGLEISRKFLRAGADDKPGLKPEYEKLKFEFRTQAGAGPKGWYLVAINGEPRDERAEDVKVGHIIAGLRELRAEEYVPVTDPAALGFAEPEMIVRMDLLQAPASGTKPLLVEVGRTEDKGGRKLTSLRVDGSAEAALVGAISLDRLPRERKQFVSPDLIDFEPQFLQEVEMVTDTGHRVKLVKSESDEPRGNERFKTVVWSVAEPAGLPVEGNAANEFVAWLLEVSVMDFLGVQPDLKVFGLDKPSVTLTLRFRPKTGAPGERVYRIGRPGDSRFAYLLKPGSDEVFQLSEEIWRRLDRTDLNFRQMTMFNTTAGAIVGMSFSYRPDHLSANPVRYAVRKVDGKWEFEGAPGAKVDLDRMDQLLGQLNYVRAEGFLTRNPRIAREYELDTDDPMGRLKIRYADPDNPGKAAEKVFRFSKSYLDPSGRARIYYCKMEAAPGDTSPSSDATIVFRIKTEFVEMLRQGVAYEA